MRWRRCAGRAVAQVRIRADARAVRWRWPREPGWLQVGYIFFMHHCTFSYLMCVAFAIIHVRARVAEWQTRRSQKPLWKHVRVRISPRAPATTRRVHPWARLFCAWAPSCAKRCTRFQLMTPPGMSGAWCVGLLPCALVDGGPRTSPFLRRDRRAWCPRTTHFPGILPPPRTRGIISEMCVVAWRNNRDVRPHFPHILPSAVRGRRTSSI